MVNGWIILDKQSGITSTKAGTIIKKIFNEKKIGHLGTLDPMASGILPIALGEATKTIHYIKNDIKEYEFNLVFGIKTDTDDAMGNIIETNLNYPIKQDILKVINRFIGNIKQIPPKYSAIHVNGKRAYDLARQGINFDIKPRYINIFDLVLIDYDEKKHTAKFKTVCSTGTYIRTLASDIAKSLNCIGHIDYLRRTKYGIFSEKDTVLLEKLKILYNNTNTESLLGLLRSIDCQLGDIPVKVISANELDKIKHGNSITGEGQGLVRLYFNNNLIAIGEFRSGYIYTKRLINN